MLWADICVCLETSHVTGRVLYATIKELDVVCDSELTRTCAAYTTSQIKEKGFSSSRACRIRVWDVVAGLIEGAAQVRSLRWTKSQFMFAKKTPNTT